jgi:hypothetical protein
MVAAARSLRTAASDAAKAFVHGRFGWRSDCRVKDAYRPGADLRSGRAASLQEDVPSIADQPAIRFLPSALNVRAVNAALHHR